MSELVNGFADNKPNLRRIKTAAFGTAGAVLSPAPGCLYHLSAVNNSATAYFVQIFDKATAPVNGDTPIWEGKLPASLDWSVGFQLFGLYCASGISIAISTTIGSLTLAAANDALAYGRYTVAT